MRIEIDIAEHHYNNIMALDSVSLGRVPYKEIIMYSINAIKHGKVLEQKPTTENDLEVQKAIEIIKADSLAPYSVDDILKARDLAVEALKQMKTAKNSLSAEEVTALAEWTAKLTKASEDAYNKGYADGMKAQEPRKGHWISHREHCENMGVMPSGLSAYEWCSNCDCGIDVREWYRNHYNFCPNCGADMREVEE